MSILLDEKATKTIINNFHNVQKTQGRAKLVRTGVYEYKGRIIEKVILPKQLRNELKQNGDTYITYGWTIDDLKGKIFRKKNYALDYIDGFVR